MRWQTLTAPQLNFLNPFVVRGVSGFLNDVRARSENLDMTARFEGLETLPAEIIQRIDRLPDDHAEKVANFKPLSQVNSLQEAGHSEKASQKAAPPLQKAERTLYVIRQQVVELSAQRWPRQSDGVEPMGIGALPAVAVSWCDSVLVGALPPGLAVI